MNFSLPCKCGLSNTGNQYCPKKYNRKYSQSLNVASHIFAQNCHTADRLDIYRCYLRSALEKQRNNSLKQTDLTALKTFIIQHFELEQLNNLQEVGECMTRHSSVNLYFEAL